MAVLLVGSVLFCVIGVLLAKPDFSNMQPFFAEISNGEVVSKGGLAWHHRRGLLRPLLLRRLRLHPSSR